MKKKTTLTGIYLAVNRTLCITMFIFLTSMVQSRLMAQTLTNFNFSPISLTDPDIVAPHRGVEEWMSMNQVNIPVEGVFTNPADAYYRFEWTHIEIAKGVYDWTKFDAECKKALDKKQKFSFGIMPMCSNCTGVSYGGAKLTYPQYLHTEMQSELNKDWVFDLTWIPNWNSNYFLTAWENLLKAVSIHLSSTYINGVKLASFINYIDIRGYGNWGEWHNYPYGDVEPLATRATSSSLNRIIKAHTTAFPDIRLVALSDAFDIANWSRVPAEVGYNLLTGSNNVGQFGWRRDNWGDPAFWFKNKLENNTTTFNGQVFSTLIMEKWKYAPIVGEPSSCCTINGGTCPYWELETQIRRYHALSFGNGNIESSATACVRENIRKAAKAAGYRIVLAGGSMTTSLQSGSAFQLNLNWQNVGITPTYEKWNVVIQLRNDANTIIWSGVSSFNLQSLMPQNITTNIQDNFTLPATVPAGTYNLVLIIQDPQQYRSPFPLAISGRNNDGSYLIRRLTVQQNTTVLNQPPTASAGADQTVVMPIQSVSLDGSLSKDPEGSTLTYQWRQTSGNTPLIFSTPTSGKTFAQNLSAGTYSIRLTVKDDKLDSAYDDMLIKVNPAPITPLVANISQFSDVSCFGGNNGSATVAVSGGTPPYQYVWNTIPVQNTAKVINLIAGTYTVNVTDAAGMNTTATCTIGTPLALVLKVSPGTISIYGGTTNVSVSATGGTTPYQFSGPTTNVTAGTYLYTVIDAKGCNDSINLTITQPSITRKFRKHGRWSNITFSNNRLLQAGITEELVESSTIYPNPTNNFLHIKLPYMEKMNIRSQIIDMNGNIVYKSNSPENRIDNQTIDVSRLHKGYYILKLFNDQIIIGQYRFLKL